MLAFIVYAFIVATLGGLVPSIDFKRKGSYRDEERNHAVRMIITWGVNFLVAFIAGFVFVPFMNGPLWGALGFSILIFSIANAFLTAAILTRFPYGGYVIIVFLLVFIGRGIVGRPIFNAHEYHSFLQPKESSWQEDFKPVDVSHIRVVSKEQAQWLGNKVIGEADGSIGSQFMFGEYSIQRVKGELYWVAPLEFRSFAAKWYSYGYTPGYVMVSAEDRNRKAEFFGGYKFNFMPSAFFGRELKRHLFVNGYATKGLTEYSFELDEDLRPWWVITVYDKVIGYWGKKVTGVVMVNPETGEHTFYTPEETPEWVDRIYPEEFVEEYVSWWGRYADGWINSWWGQERVEVPTPFGTDPSDVWMIWGEDGQPYWFTGLTSAASTDQSLTGFILVNCRTKEAKKYRLTGTNEEGVLQAVNGAVANYGGDHRAVQPILYNIYGELTWVVPVVSSKNILQKVAFVRASNSTLAMGASVVDGLRQYRNMLASSGYAVSPTSSADRKNLKGLVLKRKAVEAFADRSVYYLYFEEVPEKVFTATSDLSAELPITEVGEKVEITYSDTGEALLPIERFDNEALNIRISSEQQNLDERRIEINGEVSFREDVKDLQNQLKDLSPEELSELKSAMKPKA